MTVLPPYNYCRGHSFILKFNIMSLNVIWHLFLKFRIGYLIYLLTLKKGRDQVPFIHTSSIWDCCHQSHFLLTTNSVFRVPVRTWLPLWPPSSLSFSKRWQRRYFPFPRVVLLTSFPCNILSYLCFILCLFIPAPQQVPAPAQSSAQLATSPASGAKNVNIGETEVKCP